MIAWLSLAGALVVVAAAAVRAWGRDGTRRRRDQDWGDWPPDQMAR